MEEYRELLERLKATPFGSQMKQCFYKLILLLLDQNRKVNVYGDEKSANLRSLLEEMDQMTVSNHNIYDTTTDRMSKASNQAGAIQKLYRSLTYHTIKDVETGKIYNYITISEMNS